MTRRARILIPVRLLAALAAVTLALAPAACRRSRTSGAAVSGRCEGVLLDCDGKSSNGCETRIGTASHCGACNQRCAEGEQCLGTSCQPAGELAMSGEHTCLLERSGRVRCWGANRSGELGDGTRQMRERPVLVVAVEDAVQLVVRDRQSCVRRKTGIVSCWGNEFASGSPGKVQLTPSEVPALRGVTDLALAENVFCGLEPSGTIVCIPNSNRDKALPRIGPPPGDRVDDAVDLAAVREELCAARRAGNVTCWDMQPFAEPRREKRQWQVEKLQEAVSLTSGGATTCALRSDGKATCWGGGIVTARGAIRPSLVGGAHDFQSVGAVTDLAFLGWPSDADCATRLSGETVCWRQPRQDPPDRPFVAVDAKPVDAPPAYRIEANGHDRAYCVLTKAGEAYCWGDSSRGRLGVGRAPEQPSPRPIEGVRDVREVVASDGRACARTAHGAIHCWGGGKLPHRVKAVGVDRLLSGRCASIRGELVCFDEAFVSRLPDSGLRDVVQLVPAARGSHLLSYFARHRDGKVSRVDWKRSPRRDEGWTRGYAGAVRDLGGVKELLVAGDSTCVIHSPKELRCWSSLKEAVSDSDGKLELELRRLALPEGFEQLQIALVLDSGYYEACGVKQGKIGCWTDKLEVKWLELDDVRSFAMSPGGIRCALVADGSLSCWGNGTSNLTGDGTLTGESKPVPVAGLTGVIGFSFAQLSMYGRDAVYVWQRDGRLLAWGHNSFGSDDETRGQLGFIAPTRIDVPTKVGAD